MTRAGQSDRGSPAEAAGWKSFLWIAAVALVYFLAARISLSFSFKPEGIAAIWPPAGIFLSAILLTRRNLRPWLAAVLFFTDLAAELLSGMTAGVSLAYSAALTGEALLGAWLLIRAVGERPDFRQVRQVIGYLLLCVLFSNGLAALAAALAASIFLKASFGMSWLWWWSADGVGNLLVTPLVMSLAYEIRVKFVELRIWRFLEGVILVLLTALFSNYVFSHLPGNTWIILLFNIFIFPFLVWAAIRFGLIGTGTTTLILAVIIVKYAIGNAFVQIGIDSTLEAVILVQVFIAMAAIPAMLLSAVISERRMVENALRENEERYRLIHENSLDAILLTAPDGSIFSANPAACRMFQKTEEEICRDGRNGLADITDKRLQVLLEERERNGSSSGEITMIRKDGTKFPADVSSSVFVDRNGVKKSSMIIRDITQRKQVEDALRASEEMLKKSQDIAQIGSWILDIGADRLTWSEEVYRIFGVRPEEFAHTNGAFLELVHPDDRGAADAAYNEALRTGSDVYEFEHRIIRRDNGEVRVVYEKCENIKDASGRIVQSAGMVQDITERKRSEDKLRASEAKFSKLFHSSPDAILLTELDSGLIVDVNTSFEKFSGYSRDELIGHPVLEFNMYGPAERQRFVSMVRDNNSIRKAEFSLKNKAGETMLVLASAELIEINNRLHALTILQDISERKQAEKVLHEKEQRLASIYDTVGDVIFYLDTEPDEQYRFSSINPAFTKVTGLTAEQVVGRKVSEVIPEPSLSLVLTKYRQAIQEKTIVRWEEISEYPSGRLIGEVGVAPVFDESGKCTHLVGTVHDITERKQAETLQEAVYRIAAAAETSPSLDELYPQIHQIIASVMPAENFYIALYDREQDLLRFPYIRDAADEPFMGTVHPGKGVTAYVLRTGKSLLGTQAVHAELERRGDVILLGAPSAIWLGVPLIVEGDTIGVMSVQHYSDPEAYGEREQHMLEFVSTQVAVAIQRKKAEEALHESEERYRGLVDQSLMGIGLSLGNRVVFANPALLHIFGYENLDELAKIPLLDHVAPGSREKISALLKLVAEGNSKRADFEYDILCKDGTVKTLFASTTHIVIGGEIYSQTAFLDITERKRAEGLQEAIYRLAQAADQAGSLDELFPSIHAIIREIMVADNFYIAIHDEKNDLLRFPYMIDEAETSPTPDQKPGKGLTEYVLRKGESLLCDDACYKDLIRAGDVELVGINSPIWLGVPLIVAGRTIGVMAVQDYKNPGAYGVREQQILEYVSSQVANAIYRKQSEDEIRQLNSDLEQRVEERTGELREAQERLIRQEKLAVLGQLAGSVGHELRNPLSVINASIYYMKLAQPEASEKIKEHLGMIEQEVHSADKIISDLLDFARGVNAEREFVSVPELVQKMLKRFPAPRPVEVTLEIPADLPMVLADPHQMEQVLGNLFINACQAMGVKKTGWLRPESTGEAAGSAKVTISARQEKDMLAVSVKDNGSGITPENMKKIFEPLFTTKAKGIGLGLPVSRKLAEANGGRIEVESEPGKGSTFTLYLEKK